MAIHARRWTFLAFFGLVVGCSPPGVETSLTAAASGEAASKLQELIDDEWAARLARDPLFASSMGVRRYDERLPDVSAGRQQQYLDEDMVFLERLDALDRTALTEADRLNRDLLEFIVRSRVALGRFKPWQIPILSDGGFHIGIQRMYEAMPFDSVEDFERYLVRLERLNEYFDQNIENMKDGLRRGVSQPREILDGIEQSIEGPIVEDPADSVFFTPFEAIPRHFSESDRARLRAAGLAAIRDSVLPAYRKFLAFFTGEYKPHAKTELGASTLPDGEDYYTALVRFFTTLDDATPQAIHDLGLREVARIREEMEQIIRQVEFDGTFAEFVEFLRTDSRFYAEEPRDLLKEASYIAKKIDGQMPAFFRTLPRLPYGIMAVPDDIAPNYTTGRYWGAPINGRRGGYYLVNTYALDKRPLYELAALTAHEAVPGHHHQAAVRQEAENVPEFRRAFYPHAFGEGWGLYAEKLGIELDIYETPYDHFGRLSFEMWRACRLVIDTGIHLHGWSREQAQQYLADNTALSLHNVRTEVDRYIAWPGQALAYKMGELTILELRARAEDALGDRFDIRDFHDVVLLGGGVTLAILEEQVDEFIARSRP